MIADMLNMKLNNYVHLLALMQKMSLNLIKYFRIEFIVINFK